MLPIEELTILVPVDVSEPDPPTLEVLDLLRPFQIILLGYFPVPDQAEPALIKTEYESIASTRLDEIAPERNDLTEVIVFTHDNAATIDRVADQYECDLVLGGGDTTTINRILIPIRGDANLERIVSVVAGLLHGNDATATFFHSVSNKDVSSQGEFLLRGTVERLTEYGITENRVDWRLAEGGDPRTDITELSTDYDIVILGETEPSLRDRIIGDVLSRILADIKVPTLIVRNIE